ncbi:MAG: hypothetical protein V2A58_16405 [Planctomycetota bacterium]
MERLESIALPYDVVWRATVDVVEKDFEIERQDYEKGEIVTRYKEGRTVLEPWGMDAQTTYDRLEETLHRLRRRVVAQVSANEESGATVELVISRERLNYETPPAEYDPGPPRTPDEMAQARVQAEYAPKEQWTFVGNDELLTRKLLGEIVKRAQKLSRGGSGTAIQPL